MTDHDAEDRDAQEEARRDAADERAAIARDEAAADRFDLLTVEELEELAGEGDDAALAELERLAAIRAFQEGDAAGIERSHAAYRALKALRPDAGELRDDAEREQRRAEADELKSYPVQPGELGPVEVHHHTPAQAEEVGEPIGGLAAGVRARIRSTVEALDQPLEAAELRDAGIAIAALSASIEDLEREDGVVRVHRATVERWVRDLEELLEVLGEPRDGDRDLARRYWSVREGILDELVDRLGQRRVGELQRDGLLTSIEELRARLREAQDEVTARARELASERRRIGERLRDFAGRVRGVAQELAGDGADYVEGDAAGTPRERAAAVERDLVGLAEELAG